MSITRQTFVPVAGTPILFGPSTSRNRVSNYEITLLKCISGAALGLYLALLAGCGVFIDKPADKSTVSNPVAASITLRSYCSNFSVTLDGNDVTNQFTSPNVSPATAVFGLLPGQHTLSASAYTNVSCSGSSPNSKASSTFTVLPPHKK
jgi:hypothetical protein